MFLQGRLLYNRNILFEKNNSRNKLADKVSRNICPLAGNVSDFEECYNNHEHDVDDLFYKYE